MTDYIVRTFIWILLYPGGWRGQGRPGLNFLISSSSDWGNGFADNLTLSCVSYFIQTDKDHPTRCQAESSQPWSRSQPPPRSVLDYPPRSRFDLLFLFVFCLFLLCLFCRFVIITTLFKLAEEREKTFAKMDENGDGSIAFNEWLAFFLQVGQKLEPGIVCLIGWWIWRIWEWNWWQRLKMLLRKSLPRWRPCKFNTWSLTTAAVQRKSFDIKQKSNESFSTSDCWGRKYKQTLPSVHQLKFFSYM